MGTSWRTDNIIPARLPRLRPSPGKPTADASTLPELRLGRLPHLLCARCRGEMPPGDVAPLCPGCRAPAPSHSSRG